MKIGRHFTIMLCIIPVLLTGVDTLQAQSWDKLTMDPTVSMQDLCMLPDGLHGWAVGSLAYGGGLLSSVVRTTDGGLTWERQAMPFAEMSALNGVAFVSSTHGWVVGANGVIFATTDGGDTWTEQTSGTSRKLSKVFFLNEQVGWITGGWSDGSSYLVLRTNDGGAHWQNISFGSSCFSNEDLMFTDPLNGWIVGQDNTISPHIHHTTDGGLSWVRQTVPSGAGSPGAIDFVSAVEGWVSTSSIYQVPAGAILHTTDAGTTWKIQFYTGLHYNYCIDAKDAGNIAVAGVQILSPQRQKIFVSHDGGANWQESTPPVVAYTTGIQYVASDIWFCSHYGQILRSRDEGETWDWDYRAPYWKSMGWSDANHGWLVTGTSIGTDGYCFRTMDGGLTWDRDPEAPGGAQVQFVDEMTGWMLWEGSGASVWRTTDGGESWSRHNVGGAWIDGICFVSPLQGWAHGGNGTMRTTADGGVTWTSQSLGTSYYCDAAFFLNESEGWAGGGYGGAYGYIRHTDDGGSTWHVQNPATGDHIVSLHFLDSKNGWALGYGGRVQKTTDGGANWQYAGTANRTYSYEILMTDELSGWISVGNPFQQDPGYDGRGYIYRTTDGGTSWVEEWSGPWIMSHIYDLSLQTPARAWACGHNTTLLQRFGPAGLGEAEQQQFAWSAAPNPFAACTQISYTAVSAGTASLILYDASGRHVAGVANAHHSAGRHAFQWDGTATGGRRLASGVYLARLRIEDRSEARRIVLRR